jgi:hypothetical protein
MEEIPMPASYIRRHINNLPDDKPFSIRDFLIYGPRYTVDQVFHRLVVQGRIIRVARGVYVKDTARRMPSLAKIIEVKVASFNRRIVVHGSKAASKLTEKGQKEQTLVFASNGATSSFRVGKHIVHIIRASARKLQSGDHPAGLAIRALWHLGKRVCNVEAAGKMLWGFQQNDRKELRLSAALMPQWLRDCFACFARMNCFRSDLETLPTY